MTVKYVEIHIVATGGRVETVFDTTCKWDRGSPIGLTASGRS